MSKDSADTLVDSTSNLTLNDSSAAATSTSSNSSSSATATPAPIDDLDQMHPLQNKWSFFLNPPNKGVFGQEWQSNVKHVTDFATVEYFWGLFNELPPPSQLVIGSNYHMFKAGIQPEWEDEQNKKGGKWTIAIPRRANDPAAAKQADEAWLFTLLALIGEQFGADSDEICGVVIGPRAKETRLALWTRNGDDEAAVKRIGQFFKQNIRHEAMISYQLHDESIKKQSSHRNQAVYQV